MPELPEVESLRRSLEPVLVGARVRAATLHRADVASDHERGTPDARALLQGATIDRLIRRGKQMAIIAADGRTMVVHLGMSGQVRHDPPGNAPEPLTHVHATWALDDGSCLRFRDPRRFGGLWTLPDAGTLERTLWRDLGPDALTIDARTLAERLRATRRAIKAALLDQRVLAGVGNIYADEALFRARLRPSRRAGRTSADEATRLARAIRDVLAGAITLGGSTIRDYAGASGAAGGAQTRHQVYGRGGLPCPRCSTRLRSRVLAQRTTVWCPECQR